MYQYKHQKLTREEFEEYYHAYIEINGYSFIEYLMINEWRYYDKGKSWFAAYIDYDIEEWEKEHNKEEDVNDEEAYRS